MKEVDPVHFSEQACVTKSRIWEIRLNDTFVGYMRIQENTMPFLLFVHRNPSSQVSQTLTSATIFVLSVTLGCQSIKYRQFDDLFQNEITRNNVVVVVVVKTVCLWSLFVTMEFCAVLLKNILESRLVRDDGMLISW